MNYNRSSRYRPSNEEILRWIQQKWQTQDFAEAFSEIHEAEDFSKFYNLLVKCMEDPSFGV